MLQRVAQDRPLPGDQRVDDEHIADEVENVAQRSGEALHAPRLRDRLRHERRREAARRRQGQRRVAQHDTEEPGQDEAQHENRDRDAGVGEEHREDVDRGVATRGGEDAQGDPHDGGEEQGQQRQLQRDGQPLAEDLDHRAPLPDRIAQVALGELAQVDPELDRDRFVEPVALLEGVTDLVGGPLAKQRTARIARQQARQGEDEEDDPEQDRHAEEQPPGDESEHRRLR